MLARRFSLVSSLLTVSAFSGQVLAQGNSGNHPIRCATPAMDPAMPLPDVPSDCAYSSNNPAAAYSPAGGQLYTIPVWFHVIRRTDGTGNIPLSQLQNQITILNEDFRAMAGTPGAGGVDARIQFVLAGYDYTNNNSWFRDRGTYYNSLARDTNRYCNVYTNLAGGNLGYVPNLPQSGSLVGSAADRIVVLWSSVGRNSPYGPPYDQGRTLTHEMGHYLGLYHTFQGGCANTNCNTNGDLICDTPPESTAHFGCSQTDSCTSSGVDPIHNYMDYTDDLCMNVFSEAQARRMRCTLTSWRPLLYTASLAGGAAERHVAGNAASYRTSQPIVGQVLHGQVDLLSTGHTAALVFAAPAAANVTLPNGSHLLIETSGAVMHFGTVTGPAGFDVPIPANPWLAGMSVCTQAVHVGGQQDFALSNAVDLTLY